MNQPPLTYTRAWDHPHKQAVFSQEEVDMLIKYRHGTRSLLLLAFALGYTVNGETCNVRVQETSLAVQVYTTKMRIKTWGIGVETGPEKWHDFLLAETEYRELLHRLPRSSWVGGSPPEPVWAHKWVVYDIAVRSRQGDVHRFSRGSYAQAAQRAIALALLGDVT